MTHEDRLLQRIEQGDEAAVQELLTLYYPDILRYCQWHAPTRYLAEDAAQETFLKAIRFWDRYRHKGKCKAFLYRIAANTCIDLHRKRGRTDVSLEAVQETAAYAEPGFDAVQEALQLRQMVRGLPQSTQDIIVLRYAQGLTLREISEVLQVPLRTVQSRLRSALKQLKHSLHAKEDCT